MNIERLKHYDWPGNVRELQNVIERAVILAAALRRADGRISGPGGAASLVGGKPSTLSSRLKSLGIQGVH